MGIDYAFVPVPHALLYDTRVSLGAKVVYTFAKSRCLDKNYCLIGQERLAREMGLGLRTVERYLAELRRFGLIETRPRMGTSAVTYFPPMADLYTACGIPFESHPQDAVSEPAKSGGSTRQIRRSESATSGGQIPPPVAGKEEEGEQEKESGLDLLDLMEEDPQIQTAVAHEDAQEKKAERQAKERIGKPSQGGPIKKKAPGNVKQWTKERWADRFTLSANDAGLEVAGSTRKGTANQLKKVMDILRRREMSEADIHQFLFKDLIPNWRDISKRIFKNVETDNFVINFGLLISRLPDILGKRGSSKDRTAEALKRLGSKVKKVKL